MTLSCSVENPDGFTYEWFRQTSDSSSKTRLQTKNDHEPDTVVSRGGRYTCRGQRSEPDVFTPESDAVIIQETGEFSNLTWNKIIYILHVILSEVWRKAIASFKKINNCNE